MDEVDDIPESTVKAVAKRLKHYMEVERLEQGFDLTTSNSATGYFHSGRGLGGSYHYNRLQDKHLQHSIENPKVKARLESMGPVQKGTLTELEKTARKSCRPKTMSTETSQFKKQKYYKQSEKSSLLDSTARVLLQDHNIRSDLLHMESVEIMSEEESERSHSVQTSTSRSASRKLSSDSLGSSGRKTSRSCSSELKENQLQTPPPTPPTDDNTTSSVADVDNSTQGSDVLDGPSKSQEQPSVPTDGEDSLPASTITPAIATEAAVITCVPSTTSPLMPTVSANTPEVAVTPAAFIPQQPGIPIFYTLSPNQPPPGANILTPVFQPGDMAYPSHLPAPGSLPQQEHAQTKPVSADQEQMKSSQDSQTLCPEGQSTVTNTKERPVIIMQNVSVSTLTTADAMTQTPVHVQTQTDRSALFKISERERKKEKMSKLSESAKKSQHRENSHSSDKLVEQPLLQQSLLIVKSSSRPTSSTSSRSSRTHKSRDSSSKKKNESLLSTKAYSASHPSVVNISEMRSRSGSGSSVVSVSSRKSDSAIQKKRRVPKEAAPKEALSKGNTAKFQTHQGSSLSLHSDSAKNLDLNKPQVNDTTSPIPAGPTTEPDAPTTEPDALHSSSEFHKKLQSNPPSQENNEEKVAGEMDPTINRVPSEAREISSTSSLVPPLKEGAEALSDDPTDKLHTDSTEANQTEHLASSSGEIIKSETQDITMNDEYEGLDSEVAKKSVTYLVTSAIKDENNDLLSDKVAEDGTKQDSALDAKNEITVDLQSVEVKDEAHSTSATTVEDEPNIDSTSDVAVKDQTNPALSSDNAVEEDNKSTSEVLTKYETQSYSVSHVIKDEAHMASCMGIKDETTSASGPDALVENKTDSTLDAVFKDEPKVDSSLEDTVKDETSPATTPAIKDEADLGTEIAVKDESDPASDTAVKDEADPDREIAAKHEFNPASDVVIKDKTDLDADVAGKGESDLPSDAVIKDERDPDAEDAVRGEINLNSNADEVGQASNAAVIDESSDGAFKDETEGSSKPHAVVQGDSAAVQSDMSTNSKPQAAPQAHVEPVSEEPVSSVASPPETEPAQTAKETDVKLQAAAIDGETQPMLMPPQESPTEKPLNENSEKGDEKTAMAAPPSEDSTASPEKVQSREDVSSLSGDKDVSASSELPESVDPPKEIDPLSKNIQPESQQRSAETETDVSSTKIGDESNGTPPERVTEKPASSVEVESNTAHPESIATPESSEQIQQCTDASPPKATEASSSAPLKDSPQLQQLQVSGEAEEVPKEDPSELPQVSDVTDIEPEPSDTEPKSVPLSPVQSGQESISEQISDSPSQDDESITTSPEHKPQLQKSSTAERNTTSADGNDSSLTELDEASDVLTPVTDDADMSKESATETDSSLPPPTTVSHSVAQPAEQQPKSSNPLNESPSETPVHNIGSEQEEAREGTSNTTREDNLDKLSDISSIVTATSAEESKGSETQ